MTNSIWNKRIPTLIGIFLIATAILGTTFLTGQKTFFTQEAAPNSNPQGIRITNITSSSFTVSYSTVSPVPGIINFGKDTLNQTFTNDNDKNSIIEHQIHSFTVKNLKPSTYYSFNIISGQNTYLNNGIPYQIQTGPEIASKSATGFLVGKVVTPDGGVPKEGIAYITSTGASPLSTLLKNDGSYTVSFENFRTDSLNSFFRFGPDSKLKILVVTNEGTSNAEVLAKEIVNVPTIILSKDYNFSQEVIQISTQSAKISEFPNVTNSSSLKSPKITAPKDKETLTLSQPVFTGTGIPNDKVKILIQSTQELTGEVVVDSNGNWTFKPSSSLSPGDHTITITAKDSLGILHTITQTFTVQVALAASPSPTSTPLPTSSPSASLSPSVSPTPTPTPIVVSTPNPSPIALSTPAPTLPPTGSSEINTGIFGISLALIGGLFLLLGRFLL